MKVYIGPYLNWYGPYQIAEMLRFVGVSDETCFKIGGWLHDTWIGKFCQWVHDKRKRTVKVKIHSYDVWSADYTLALIILPVLLMIRQNKHSYPVTENSEDTPQELWDTKPKENPWDHDSDSAQARWEHILGEMIWAFETIISQNTEGDQEPEYGTSEYKAYHKRLDNGLRLFGKYYRALWD